MSTSNSLVVTELKKISYMYRQKKEAFKSKAFSKASEAVEAYVGNIIKLKDPTVLPSVGKSIAKTIKEILNGDHHKLQKLEKNSLPATLEELEVLPGVGPAGAKKIFEKYKSKTWKDLVRLFKNNKIEDQGLREAITQVLKNGDNIPLYIALEVIIPFINSVRSFKLTDKIRSAGSLRRRNFAIKDLDLVISVTERNRGKLISKLQKYYDVFVLGEKKIRIKVEFNDTISKTIDIVLTEPKSFGNAMNYFTGSKDFNIAMRTLAKKKGFKVNEHFTTRLSDGKKMPSANERDLFKLLEIPYVPPVCRVSEGAVGKDFGNRIRISDIRGQVHNHTTFSDGQYSPIEVASLSAEAGLEFIAISDHSSAVGLVGMKEKSIPKYMKAISQANERFNNKCLTVYSSLECDINKVGKLDYSPKTLRGFDFLLLATHMQPGTNITERLLTAFEFCRQNDIKCILTHPTGRILGFGKQARPEAEADWEKIFRTCSAQNILVEINAQPMRMDPSPKLIRKAKHLGCKFIINADSHNGSYNNTKFGIWLAQSAWLNKSDVVNTCHSKFIGWLRR